MYNYRSGHVHPSYSCDHSAADYFRDANSTNGQQYLFRQNNLVVSPVNPAQQLAAVRMSQAGYNSNTSGGGAGHSMQPSHHQTPGQTHAGMPYHQQQASGPPYVIGPGQYNNTQFPYRQQQPNSYQQHQSPTQQQQQQPGRPTFVGINAIPTSAAPRVPTSHPSSTPYLVQQQNSQSIRMSQQQQQQALSSGMQPSQSQASFMAPRSVVTSIAHQQSTPQQLIASGHVQPQLVRVQQSQQPHQQQVLSGGNARMQSNPGQLQVIATSATSSGLMMPAQYTGQGVYQRPVILQQQPIVVQQPQSQQQTTTIINSQQQPQQTTIQYQYKQSQQTLASQLQQGPSQSVLPKQQPAPSPSSVSSSASSTPAAQFAAPNQVIPKSDLPAGLNSSPSPATISALNTGTSASISDLGAAGSSGVQSDSSQVLTKQRLEDLVREVDPYEQLDEDVKETLLHIADEFIESVVSGACQIAKHRKAASVDVKDVQLCLERNWNMWIPGFGTDDIRPYKKACVTDAHKQRTALIKKTLKKI